MWTGSDKRAAPVTQTHSWFYRTYNTICIRQNAHGDPVLVVLCWKQAANLDTASSIHMRPFSPIWIQSVTAVSHRASLNQFTIFPCKMRRSFAVQVSWVQKGPVAAVSSCAFSCLTPTYTPRVLHAQTTAKIYCLQLAQSDYHRDRRSDGFYSAHFFTPLLAFSVHFVVMHCQCIINVREHRRTAVETSDQKEAMLQDSGNQWEPVP